MIAEIDIDNDNKIVQRTLTGAMDTDQALKLFQNVSFAVKLNRDDNFLVDIRDTTFHPQMDDLI